MVVICLSSSQGTASRVRARHRVPYRRPPSPALAGHVSRTTRPHDLPSQTRRQTRPPTGVGEPGPTELLPQPRLRLIVVARAVLILVIAAALYLVRRAPRAGRQRRRPDRSPRTSSRDRYQIETLAARRGRAPGPDRGRRRPPDRGRRAPAPARVHRPAARVSSPTIALERLIDTKLQAKLAVEEGVTATPEDIDARLVDEATTPESAPRLDDRGRARASTSGAVDADGRPEGRGQGQGRRPRSRTSPAGKTLGGRRQDRLDRRVDRRRRPATSAGSQADDTPTGRGLPQGRLRRRARTRRPPSSRATTGSSGSVASTEIVADDGRRRLPGQARERRHRRSPSTATVVQGDVIHEKLEDKIVGRRHRSRPAAARVARSTSGEAAPDLGDGRDQGPPHPVLAERRPAERGDASPADRSRPGRPPQSQADGAYARLKADPDAVRRDRPRGERRGAAPRAPTGTRRQAALLRQREPGRRGVPGGDPRPGSQGRRRSCEPVKSAFGWHVIQVMYRPTDVDHLEGAQGGTPTAARTSRSLARDNSEAPTAGVGGDIGWIAKGQLDDR